LAVGVTGVLLVLAAAVLVPDSVMALLPWRANEAFLPSNATDVARGCSGIDTVPDFSFDRCALSDGLEVTRQGLLHKARRRRLHSQSHACITRDSVC
jgi:hypothetical protein